MPVFKCMVGFNDGHIGQCDGIAHERKLWLVPGWRVLPQQIFVAPERIIRFDNQPHMHCPGEAVEYQNIQLPMPESALHGAMPRGIEYVDHPPNLLVPIHEVQRQ